MSNQEIREWASSHIDLIVDAVEADEHIGFCVACGEMSEDNVEPDAREYKCDNCGERAVYGAEELILYI